MVQPGSWNVKPALHGPKGAGAVRRTTWSPRPATLPIITHRPSSRGLRSIVTLPVGMSPGDPASTSVTTSARGAAPTPPSPALKSNQPQGLRYCHAVGSPSAGQSVATVPVIGARAMLQPWRPVGLARHRYMVSAAGCPGAPGVILAPSPQATFWSLAKRWWTTRAGGTERPRPAVAGGVNACAGSPDRAQVHRARPVSP